LLLLSEGAQPHGGRSYGVQIAFSTEYAVHGCHHFHEAPGTPSER
jgi:hypothetical protein